MCKRQPNPTAVERILRWAINENLVSAKVLADATNSNQNSVYGWVSYQHRPSVTILEPLYRDTRPAIMAIVDRIDGFYQSCRPQRNPMTDDVNGDGKLCSEDVHSHLLTTVEGNVKLIQKLRRLTADGECSPGDAGILLDAVNRLEAETIAPAKRILAGLAKEKYPRRAGSVSTGA